MGSLKASHKRKENNMIKMYQVTLFCASGKYKPVSDVVKADDLRIIEVGKNAFIKEVKQRGIVKICQKRYWTSSDLKRYDYTKAKVREYNREKIEQEKKEKYEQIKIERGWVIQ